MRPLLTVLGLDHRKLTIGSDALHHASLSAVLQRVPFAVRAGACQAVGSTSGHDFNSPTAPAMSSQPHAAAVKVELMWPPGPVKNKDGMLRSVRILRWCWLEWLVFVGHFADNMHPLGARAQVRMPFGKGSATQDECLSLDGWWQADEWVGGWMLTQWGDWTDQSRREGLHLAASCCTPVSRPGRTASSRLRPCWSQTP